MTHLYSKMHQYQRTRCSSKANAIPFDIYAIWIRLISKPAQSRVSCAIAVVVYLNSGRVCNYDRVMVHRTAGNEKFGFKKCTKQYQHTICLSKGNAITFDIYAINICIRLTSKSAHSRVLYAIAVVVVYSNSGRVCNYDRVIVTHSNSSMHQYQRTLCSFKANAIPFHAYIHSTSAQSCVPCVIVVVVCLISMHQYQRTICASKANAIPFHISNQH